MTQFGSGSKSYCSHICLVTGGAGGVPLQCRSRQRLPEEERAGQRQVAAVRVSLLLLHGRMQPVARHMSQQEGQTRDKIPECPQQGFSFWTHWCFLLSQTRRSIHKLLEWENNRLYHKVPNFPVCLSISLFVSVGRFFVSLCRSLVVFVSPSVRFSVIALLYLSFPVYLPFLFFGSL